MGDKTIERYKYRAINAKGRPIRGVISAANEVDLYGQLQTAGLELVQCSLLNKKSTLSIGASKITNRDMIQLFLNLEQMQSAGVPMLDSLNDIRDTTENNSLRDMLTEVTRDVSDGSSLSEALAKHPKVFTNLYVSLIHAGEETGDLTLSYMQLIKYLKWVDEMQTKIKKATRYPMILMVAVIGVVTVMMGHVVPQIASFITNIGQELPVYTTALIATSDFFQDYWWAVVFGPVGAFVFLKLLRSVSEEFKYRTDLFLLSMPIAGILVRKISVARYAQTFGALFSSGIDVLGCLDAAKKTITNLAIMDALDVVDAQVSAGAPLSEAFNASGEFPSMVVRMVKIGEESGNLTPVLEQVSEFYTKDVDDAVDGLITMIEPMLTAILGGMILWIAVAVFGPIYGSFENLDI